MPRYAILAQPQKTDVGRAVHSLLYAQQLHAAGEDVKVYYDGEGTTWIPRFEDPQFPYNALYTEVREAGLIAGACKYCSEVFGVSKEVGETTVPFMDHDNGHPSVARLLQEGHTILTL